LRYPRRVYTNLFPAAQTWWLALLLVVLNGIDWAAFEVLNRDNPIVISIPLGYRIMDGLFQSFSVRSSGFTVISISNLAFGLQTLYVMMMYISAFPVVITMRNSNVYEERSLGIYAADIRADLDSNKTHDPNTNKGEHIRRTRLYFLREQVQRQLGHDIWFIIICVILVVWIETPSISADPVNYSIFNIIFEVVSAYGCVGLSLGAPGQDYSFSGVWHTSAKLILCGLMLRGRHRGLPVEIDKAIELPEEKQEDEEREEMSDRGERRRASEKEGV
jgi:Trk-type K+ transport system membrane component